jgi:putative peptidoglycan lipid II flippase
MTGPRPPGPSSSPGRGTPPTGDTPPEWFHQTQQDLGERTRLEQLQVDREQAQQVQAQRARDEREQAQREAVARVNGTRHPLPGQPVPGREVRGPVRQNATPWVGVPPGAMFPAAEDATMLIQRITDQAVTREVADDATVSIGGSATEGMRTASTAGVVRAGALMAIATVVSRVTGLLSKVALVAIIGSGLTNSAYTVANTLPNIVFELLIGGVLTSVAIPLLTRAQRSDADGGQEYTQRLMTIAVVGLLVATVIAVVAAPVLTHIYAPTSSVNNPDLPAQLALTTKLGRLLLPQIFFYGVAALFGAILNTKERFAANAWAPVLNNIVVIVVAGVLLVVRVSGSSITRGLTTTELLVLGIGTTLGIVLQAVVMVPALLQSGFRFRWRWGWDHRLTEAGGLVGWALVYVVISQVGVVVTTRVAFGSAASGPLVFSYASLLFQMPYGILGVAVLTAIMPRLARHAAAGQMEDVKDDVSLANRLSSVALLPVSAALIVLGTSLATVLFGHGQAVHSDVIRIGVTIAAMAIGLVPLSMTLVQMRVFYAVKDGRTPTIINGIMVAVRVPLLLLSATLEPKWIVPALALSTAASYVIGAVVGEFWLRARFGRMGTTRTLHTIGKMIAASAAGGGAAYLALRFTVGVTPDGVLDAVKILLVGGTVGLLVIAVMTSLLKVQELAPVRRRVLGMLGFPSGVTATSPSAMGGSARPADATPKPRTPIREQVTERVSDAGAGGPRNVPDPHVPDPQVPDSHVANGPVADVRPTGTPASGPNDTTIGAGTAPGMDRTVTMGGPPGVVGPPVVLAPGATVGGRYRLVSLVGADDAGNRFWRAKDTVLPRDMAVTLLPDTNAASATVARTLRVGRLHHIGLPQTLDVGTEQGQSYVVGQWVDGATLTDLLAGGPLEPDVATSITAKVSEAVAEAHRNGIALGAINPSLVRVNFDGQVRLSHVIAHGNATPEQDIRAVGGLLYLMLTGTWPLPAGAAAATGGAGLPGQLTPAPTRMGREIPANEVRPGVPEALSALAERALHPDDPAGIHAVGAIAALLRQPDIAPPAPSLGVEEPSRPVLNPAERRLVKERRAKLGVAAVMIAAFSALIIIVVASLAKQVMGDVAGPTVTGVAKLTSAPVAPPTTPAPPKTSTGPASTDAPSSGPSTATSSPSVAPAPAPAVQKIVTASVYDPKGNGVKDFPDRVPLAYDGDPSTFWETFVYNQQFPSALKPGVGLQLSFASAITPTSVTVSSDTPTTAVPGAPSTIIEVRSATGVDLPYEQTTAIARGTINPGAPGSVTITLTSAPKSQYLVIFVVQMAVKGSQFQSHINEISVSGN